MKKRILSIILAALMIAGPAVLLCTAVSSADASSPVKVEITQTPSGDGDADAVDVKIKVTNTSDFSVYNVSSRADSAEGLEIVSLSSDEVSKLLPQESIETNIRLKVSANAPTNKDGKGCRNSLAAAGIVFVIIAGCAALFFVKGRNKTAGASVLFLVLCLSAMMLPIVTAAESASADASAPSVKITRAIALGSDADFRQLAFDCEYSEGKATVLNNSIGVTLGGKEYPVVIVSEFNEYGDFSMGVRALPISGLDTLPLSLQKGKTVDLSEKTVGSDLELDYPDEPFTFTGIVGDKFYPKFYTVKYTAMAYLRYYYHGEPVTVFSEAFTSSVRNAAQETVKDQSIGQEEKDDLQNNVINKAGKTYSLPEAEEKALREGIVARMNQMASVVWTPANTISTNGQINYSTPTYNANQQYSGLIYNQYHYGTAEDFSYRIGANGILDPNLTKNVSTIWNSTPGVSCSTSITGAYAYFCPGIKQVTGATKMNPATQNTGFTKIGSYAVPTNAKSTSEILKANDEQTIYQAYAQMKTADILCANWYNSRNELLGHVIMAREDPIIVKKADGSIDPNRSRIRTIEQHSTVIQQNGVNTTWKLAETSFNDLMHGSLPYVPVRYTDLTADYSIPCYCIISNLDSASILTKGLSGTLESNFDIRYLGVTVTDGNGKTVYDIKVTPSTGYVKGMLLSSEKAINSKLAAIPAGTYNVRICACVKNAEHVLLDTVITK